MAPLSQASKLQYHSALDDGTKVYQGVADPEWAVGVVTFGGYSLSLLLNAASEFQSDTQHPDPIYLTSQFFRASTAGPLEIHVRLVRKGKQFDNLVVQLYQKNSLMTSAQMIYGDLDATDGKSLTLPETYRPLCPLKTYPAGQKITPKKPYQGFASRYVWAEDQSIFDDNARMAQDGRTVEGLRWGTWMQLKPDEVSRCGYSAVPIFADHPITPWTVLPSDVKGDTVYWLPTLAMSIEFKRKLPLDPEFASHTFGVYGWKRHLENGRWNDMVEIWSAPSNVLDEFEERPKDSNWREKMVCVAVSSQVALMVHADVNARYSEGKSKL